MVGELLRNWRSRGVTKEEVTTLIKGALELFKRQELQMVTGDWNPYIPTASQRWTDKHDILRKEMKEKLKELEWRIRALEEEDAS